MTNPKKKKLRLILTLISLCTAINALAIPPLAPQTVIAPTNISTGATVRLSWSSVSYATKYVVEQQRDGGNWALLYTGAATSTSTNLSNTPGLYYFRVKACNATECSAYTMSGQTQAVIGAPNSSKRRVIYIHTDLLGSPAAETDENGNLTKNPN